MELTPTLTGPADDPQISRCERDLTLSERIRLLGAERDRLREEVRSR